jgi:hypothetical protein
MPPVEMKSLVLDIVERVTIAVRPDYRLGLVGSIALGNCVAR